MASSSNNQTNPSPDETSASLINNLLAQLAAVDAKIAAGNARIAALNAEISTVSGQISANNVQLESIMIEKRICLLQLRHQNTKNRH